jgi:hypothetical protein
MTLKTLAKKVMSAWPELIPVFIFLHNKLLGFNSITIKGKNNRIYGLNNSLLRNVSIKILGNDNKISIKIFSNLDNCTF